MRSGAQDEGRERRPNGGASSWRARQDFRRGSDALERLLLVVAWLTGALLMAVTLQGSGRWGAPPSFGLLLVLVATARLAALHRRRKGVVDPAPPHG